MKIMRVLALVLFVAAGRGPVARAQSRILASGQEYPQFDVASVKPNKSGAKERSAGFQTGVRFVARNSTLRDLIAIAYGSPAPLRNFQIVGGPSWLDGDTFDVDAAPPAEYATGARDRAGAPPFGQFMLRALLQDRFQLVEHVESREFPIYSLTIAARDGRPGRALRPASASECFDIALMNPASREPNSLPPCGVRRTAAPNDGIRMIASGATMEQVATNLELLPIGSAVLNRTALPGRWSFEIEFARELSPPGDGAQSIFTTLQERLGLKLDSTKGPVDVLVVDRAERPLPD